MIETNLQDHEIYMGKNIAKKHYSKAVEQFIDEDEYILAFFKGKRDKYSGISGGEKFEQSMGLKKHFLIITNKKIVFWMKGFFTKDFVTFDYDKVTYVEGKKGLKAGDLILKFSGHQERFRDMNKQEGLVASNFIKGLLETLKERKLGGNIANNVHKGSDNEALNIAQSRYAKGEITKKEFDQILSDLQKSSPRNHVICKGCGTENAVESVYCISCGTTLE